MNTFPKYSVSRLALLVLLPISMMLSGCLGAGNMKSVRKGLMEQLPEARFDRQFGMYIGSVAVGTARLITRLVPDDEAQNAGDYLRDVKRLRVSVYNVSGIFDLDHVATPKPLADLQNRGWEMAVKVREEDSMNWLLFKEKDDELRDLYVVTLSDESFVMVRAHGNFTKLVERAIANQAVPDEIFSWR